MKVREIEKGEKVRSIAPTATIAEAMTDLDHHYLHHLLVVDNGKVLGLITDRDILRTYLNYGTGAPVGSGVRVRDIMTPVAVVSEDAELGEILRLMIDQNITAVPIQISEDEVDIISQADMIILLEKVLRTDHKFHPEESIQYGLSNPLFQSIMKIMSDMGI